MFKRSTFLSFGLLSGLLGGLTGCSNEPAARSTRSTAVNPAAVPPASGSGEVSASTSDSGTSSDVATGTGTATGSTVASGTGTATGTGTGSDLQVVITDEDPEKDFKPAELTDEEALTFLKTNCAVCHKPGAGNDSAWPMGAELDFTKAKFGSDPFAPAVFATVGNKFLGFKDTEASPKPMPPSRSVDLEYKKQLAGILVWMKANFEVASADGEERLGGPLNLSGPRVSTHYKCATPPTKSQFMRRIFNDLFDRTPSATEQARFYAAAEAKDAATGDFRTKLLDDVFLPGSLLNGDFRSKGLRKFADKVTGSTSLVPSGDLTSEMIVDLKKEFMQLLLKYVETMSFKDMLLANKVLVTKKTARLYGADCDTAATSTGWTECSLTGQGPARSTFFGSVGYLALWPSSFLRNNNNYTRIAHLYTVLSGEALKPKTTGPTGGDAENNPALKCMKSGDNRGRLANPLDQASGLLKNGTLAIPNVGAYCQSCHIGRNLANGSIVFRKFGLQGEIIGKDDINAVTITATPPATKPEYYDQVKEAADAGRVFIDKDVTGQPRNLVTISDHISRLANLLDVNETENKGCFVTTVDGEPVEKEIRYLSDLVAEIIGDGKILAQGLGRHIPRAFGNQAVTNQEILSALSKAYTDGDGKLYPLFAAYLKTESYACVRADTAN